MTAKHARVQANGKSSVAFSSIDEVKRGCVLAPTLVSIMFSAILFDAFIGSDIEIDIRYITDGSVLNLRRFQAKIKVNTGLINELLSPTTVH